MRGNINRSCYARLFISAFAVCAALLLSAAPLSASPAPDSFQLIRQAYREGRITADQVALYYTYKIKDPAKLPVEFRSDTLSRGATTTLLWIRKHWEEFSAETRRELSGYPLNSIGRSGMRAAYSRPVLTSEKTYSTSHFKFHFTTASGDEDEVASTDTSPSNGTPDYVDMMATEFEYVWTAETGSLGYTRPPDDGDGRFDVYIGDIVSLGFYGLTFYDTLVGDNTYSADYVETNAMTSYMIMDNDYSGLEGAPLVFIQTTAAHEFFHCIQIGYDGAGETWLMEASATWVEDIVYDALDNNYQYLPGWFESPDLGLSSEMDYNYYGSWIFMRYISEHHGGAATIKRIWEISRTHDNDNGDYSFQTVGEALAEKGATFDTVFVNFAIANRIMEPTGSGHPYTYEEAADYTSIYGSYPPARIERTINFTGAAISHSSSSDGNGRLNGPSADYIKLTGTSPLKVNFNGDDSAKFAVRFIKKISAGFYVIDGMTLNSANEGLLDQIDPPAYSEMTLVVINLGTTGNSAQYTLNISTTYIDNDPPIQSYWYPANGANITTTTPEITFILDENGDCRWSLTDQAYSAMAGDCAGDGTTSQTCAVTGMQEGADSVYIACNDTVGNADTANTNDEISYNISLFSLALKAGWNFIGVSLADASMLPASPMEVTYFARQGDYAFESSQSAIALNFKGAYWIYSANAANQKISGENWSGDAVALHPGWSAFSIPYTIAVAWAQDKAYIYCDEVYVNLPNVYEYDTDLGEYIAIAPNAGNTLAPWKGYWIHLDDGLQEPCQLTLTE